MRIHAVLPLILLFLFATLPAAEKISIAVLDFANNTGDSQIEHWKYAIRDMITTDIQQIPDITVVERARLDQVLQEINLNQSKYVDKTNAVKIGKLLRASHLLTGAYFKDLGRFRFDIRLVNTERGAVVYADKVEGNADIFKLEHLLICAILKNMKPGITEHELEYLRLQKEKSLTPAERFLKGLLAERSGFHTDAVKWYRQSAESGYAPAQCKLGACYYEGKGVKKDLIETVRWLRKSAMQGYAVAQFALAGCYSNGYGVKQDYSEAVKWYRMAADQGLAIAQTCLGFFYQFGHGIQQNYSEAVKWHHMAAMQNNALAQYNLGNCYYYGQGVKQDYSEAVNWYRKAGEKGFAPAEYSLGDCYRNGYGVKQDYSESVKWCCKAAEQGYPPAQYILGSYYTQGRGVKQNYAEAAKWYQKAAEEMERPVRPERPSPANGNCSTDSSTSGGPLEICCQRGADRRCNHERSNNGRINYGETNSFFPWLTTADRKVENFIVHLKEKKKNQN